MKKSGSSLVLVMIVVAGILTIVFGTQRLSLTQFSQSNREEDTIFATYAARSGIEDGLARFRFYRDVESERGQVYRVNLTDGRSSGAVGAGVPISDDPDFRPTKQFYDLAIDFKTNQIGSFAFDNSPLLADGTVLELTGFPTVTESYAYFLRSGFRFIAPGSASLPTGAQPCLHSNPFVQIQRIDENGTILDQVTATTNALNDGFREYDSRQGNANIEIQGVQKVNFVRVRPFGCDVLYAFATANTNNGASSSLAFEGLVGQNGTFITRLTATGYYGTAKRTLIAEIDRQSGQLLGVYDFHAYAGGRVGP